jgi:class 3 adenylate cyclase/tetratricopeptide (TPR) repeat protein
VTVLFADVANYTSIAEKLDPEEIHRIMDGCFNILMDEIHEVEGTINQFTGDGIMALFGAPVAHEDHAQRACYAALSIQKAIREYSDKIEEDTGLEFNLRVGLNSGPVVVGAIGNDLRMDYTAVGDTTNLGSRMETMAKPGTTLVSGNTYRLVKDFFEFEVLGKIEVKGKEEPQEAFELIRTGEVETRIGASMAKGLTRFVGRKNSMAALKEPYEEMLAGSGQVVGVVGEAGVGKSRLLLEFIKQISQHKVIYLEGRCMHYGGSIIYMPFIGILKKYLNIKDDDPDSTINKALIEKISALDEKLVDSISPLQDLLSLKVEDAAYLELEPKKKREKTFEALRDLLLRASKERPLILAVEDLHWIDKTSEEFLNYLIGWLANTRLMIILLYRPEYTHQWGSKSYYKKIGLTQLGTVSSSQLVQAILEEGEVAQELKQLVLNRTAGNPLFIEEFTCSLIENDLIQKRNNQFILSKKAADIQIPDTIQGIIAARMDLLEDNLKRTMQVASVIGREFAFRILQTISGMREEIKSYLLNLQGLEFIYEKSLFPELEYIFKHALTQEVAYNSLLLSRRKEIHDKIGRAIEGLYPHRLEEFYEMLSYHYAKSDNLEKAYQYFKFSGQKALDNHSYHEAFGFFRDAINVLSRMPDTEERKREQIQVTLLIAEPSLALIYPEDSLNILQNGEKLSKELGDEKSLAQFYSYIGTYYTYKEDINLAIKYQENCFEEAEKIQNLDLMVPVAWSLCIPYTWKGEYLKTISVTSKVITLLEKTKRESEFFGMVVNPYSTMCSYYGAIVGALGSFEEGKNWCEKALAFSRVINDLMGLALIEFCYGDLLLTKGEAQEGIEHLQKSLSYCEDKQVRTMLGLIWAYLGYGYYLLDDLETAKNYNEKGLAIHQETGRQDHMSGFYLRLGLINLAAGELEEVQANVEKGLALAKKDNEKYMEAQLRIIRGRVIAKKDPSRMTEAEQSVLKGIEMLNTLKIKTKYAEGYYELGELYVDVDQKEKALPSLKKAEEMFLEMGMDYWLDKTQESLKRL